MKINPRINIEERSDYLRFHVIGVDSLKVSIEYFTSIAEKCRKCGYKSVLIIEELQGQLSIMEMYELCTQLPDLFLGLKLAFVDLVSEHIVMNKFRENLVVNRGCDARVFTNEKEAEHWLSFS